MTEQLHFHFSLSSIGEGNGNPLQCSCLENPRDGGAWRTAIYGVAQSRTRLKWLSSSSSSTAQITIGNAWSYYPKHQSKPWWFNTYSKGDIKINFTKHKLYSMDVTPFIYTFIHSCSQLRSSSAYLFLGIENEWLQSYEIPHRLWEYPYPFSHLLFHILPWMAICSVSYTLHASTHCSRPGPMIWFSWTSKWIVLEVEEPGRDLPQDFSY